MSFYKSICLPTDQIFEKKILNTAREKQTNKNMNDKPNTNLKKYNLSFCRLTQFSQTFFLVHKVKKH